MQCKRCGALMNRGLRICPHCGARQKHRTSHTTCATCHHRAPSNLSLCPQCGQRLRARRFPVGRLGLVVGVLLAALVWYAGVSGDGMRTAQQFGEMQIAAAQTRLNELGSKVLDTASSLADSAVVVESPTPTAVVVLADLPTELAEPVVAEPATMGVAISLADDFAERDGSAVQEPPTPTETPLPTATAAPPTATPTQVPPTATPTQVPPTATPTQVPPTATPTQVLPTATPTQVPPTATPTQVPPTAVVAAVAAGVDMPRSVPSTATPTPVPPTATPQPPTATPRLPTATATAEQAVPLTIAFPAPQLLAPSHLDGFSADSQPLLEWIPVSGLTDQDYYHVRVVFDLTDGEQGFVEGEVTGTAFRIERWVFDAAQPPDRLSTWTVQVKRRGPGGQTWELSPPSEARTFYWR